MSRPGSYANGFAPRDGIPLYPSLWTGCVGAWAPCLGPSGLTLRDWGSLCRQHGTLNGFTTSTDWVCDGGRYGLTFSGAQYVEFGAKANAAITHHLTISMWVRFTNTAVQSTLLSNITAGGTSGQQFEYNRAGDNTLSFLQNAASVDAISTGTITDTKWHHVGVVRTGSVGDWTITFYIDGISSSHSTSVSPIESVSILTLGRAGEFAGQYTEGVIDDVRVYARALSHQEMTILGRRRGIAYELDRSVAVIEVAAEDLIVGDTSMAWSVNYRENGSDVVKHVFAWVSAADGTATVPSSIPVSGRIERVVIVPSASAAPTSLYDVTLTDSNSIDVLAGQGANLSATVSSSVCPGTPLKDGTTVSVTPTAVDSILTLNVTNAGDTKSGTVVVYVR